MNYIESRYAISYDSKNTTWFLDIDAEGKYFINKTSDFSNLNHFSSAHIQIEYEMMVEAIEKSDLSKRGKKEMLNYINQFIPAILYNEW